MVSGGGHLVRQESHENDKGQQEGQTVAHLFTGFCRQHEDEDTENPAHQDGKDEVQAIVGRLPFKGELVRNLQHSKSS